MSLGTSGTIFAVADRPAEDPSGIVAGFADATGRFLPLAATLNCTVAVDRVAGWLGLDRDDVEPAGDVVVLPYFDGERTPNLPSSSGTIQGLRHTTTPATDPDGRLRRRGRLAAGRLRCDRRGRRWPRSRGAAPAGRRRRSRRDVAVGRPPADRSRGPDPGGDRGRRHGRRRAGGGHPPRREPARRRHAAGTPDAASCSIRSRQTPNAWPGSEPSSRR